MNAKQEILSQAQRVGDDWLESIAEKMNRLEDANGLEIVIVSNEIKDLTSKAGWDLFLDLYKERFGTEKPLEPSHCVELDSNGKPVAGKMYKLTCGYYDNKPGTLYTTTDETRLRDDRHEGTLLRHVRKGEIKHEYFFVPVNMVTPYTPKPWKPEMEERYLVYCVNGQPDIRIWKDSAIDRDHYACGNCYPIRKPELEKLKESLSE